MTNSPDTVSMECLCGEQITLDESTPAESQARLERWTQEHAGCDPESDNRDAEMIEKIHLENEWVDWFGGSDDE